MQTYFNPYSDIPETPDIGDLTPEEQQRLRLKCSAVSCMVYVLAFAVVIAFCILFGSCTTTQYVPVIENHTDTLIQTKVLRDSVWLHDSIHVMERGDTVLIEKWHTRYVTKETHDTTYVSKTDSVPVPYPVEVQVPAELTWWQQTRLHLANVLLWTLLIAGAGWLLKKKLWR